MGEELRENKKAAGIWRYSSQFPSVKSSFWLSLNEGNTPVVEIDRVYFKREDCNPTGSIKDRGMAYQVSSIFEAGIKDVVISSSGNAGISAANYCQLGQARLHVFVSPKINRLKLEKLEKTGIEIFITLKPVSDALKYAKKNNFLNLRSSLSDEAAEGYQTLAFELHRDFGKVDSVFIPVSSGTTLVGLVKGYKQLGYLPRIQVVQTTAVCPIAGMFDRDYLSSKTSLAEALVAKATPRKWAILKLLSESRGWGWVVSDSQINEAADWLEKHQLTTSFEGAAALAAVWKARKSGSDVGDKVVCLLTGIRY